MTWASVSFEHWLLALFLHKLELMTMRTCWIVCEVPAGNRLDLSCPGHKSKGSTTKRCMLGKKNKTIPATHHPPRNTSSPSKHIIPLETHHPPLHWQPVATSNHHVPSITARETMLRLVGWQAGSPWQRKDPLWWLNGERDGARERGLVSCRPPSSPSPPLCVRVWF